MIKYLKTARDAASAAAELLNQKFINDAGVLIDNKKDIKTKADVVAQDVILSHLHSSGISVIAEEGEMCDVDIVGKVWLVDPLDGTLNFTRGFPMAAVSIALWDKGAPMLGVVHDIFSGRVYSGVVGVGAWLNDKEMKVSGINSIASAVLATGFPSGRSYDTDSLLNFVQSVQSYKKVRMLGSAALMLAQIAAGHFDVYEEEDIYLWDVAAGLALVKAAGGAYSMDRGSGQYKYRIRATNGQF
jgi:myo-inositol-1(or 4)-monophosphatase